jgi:hypothetical protein
VNKKTKYTKKEIEQARAEGNMTIIADIANRLLKGEKMSVAETEAACSIARFTRPENAISYIDLASIPQAQDYIFKNLYVTYYDDLEGQYGIQKANGLVSLEEKKEDLFD